MELLANKTMWFIAHTNLEVFHCGKIEEGQYLASGQETLETFDTLEEWAARKAELGIVEPTPEEPIV